MIVNSHHLTIPTAESHIYVDSHKHIFAYGGSPAQQAHAVQSFLNIDADHQKLVVYGTDDSGKYRIPWSMRGGQVVPGMPVEKRGFLGMFKSFMKAPDPKDFRNVIN